MSQFSPPVVTNASTPKMPTQEKETVRFRSVFSKMRFGDTCMTITTKALKGFCWKDARVLKDLHGENVFRSWQQQVETFCGEEEDLRDTLMQMTSVYLDFSVGYLTKDGAARLISKLEYKLDGILSAYRPVQQSFALSAKDRSAWSA